MMEEKVKVPCLYCSGYGLYDHDKQPHDFGWVLRQMRAGECVERGYTTLRIKDDKLQYWVRHPIGSHWDNPDSWICISEIAEPTDWAICADPEGVE